MCDKRELVLHVTLWNNTSCKIAMLKLMVSYMGHKLSTEVADIRKVQTFYTMFVRKS